MSRPPSESVHSSLRDLRMKTHNRGPKLIYNQRGPFVTEPSPELASRGISSSSNVNRDSGDPQTEPSPETTLSPPKDSPGSASLQYPAIHLRAGQVPIRFACDLLSIDPSQAWLSFTLKELPCPLPRRYQMRPRTRKATSGQISWT